MTRFLTFAVFALLPLLARGESYICTTDMATGFAYENGVWKQTRFNPDQKFIVRPATESERTLFALRGDRNTANVRWLVEPLGAYQIAYCSEDFKPNGELVCHGLIEEFRMNKNSLRFQWAYLSGYWDGGDTPMVGIGKCSPI